MKMIARSVLVIIIVMLLSNCDNVPPPEFNVPPVIGDVDESTTFNSTTLTVSARDPNGDPMTYEYAANSRIAQLTPNGNRVTISGVPDIPPVTITITVKDDKDGVSTKKVILGSTNSAPSIAGFGTDKRFAAPNETVTLAILAQDTDNDSLRYSITSANEGIIMTVPYFDAGFTKAKATIAAGNTSSVEFIARVFDGKGGEATTNLIIDRKQLEITDTIEGFQPYAMAFNRQGELFVSNINNMVYKIDANNNVLQSFTHRYGSIRAMAIDTSIDDGLIYLGSQGDNNGLMNQSGGYSGDWLLNTFAHYITPFKGNTFLISNEGNNLIEQIDFSGNLLQQFGLDENDNPIILRPRQIYTDPANQEIYVADRQNGLIQVLDYNGNKVRQYSASDQGGLDRPHGVAYHHKNGVLYIGDTFNDRVLVYTRDGRFIQEIKPPGTTQPRYILIDDQDRVYIAYYAQSKVLVYDFK